MLRLINIRNRRAFMIKLFICLGVFGALSAMDVREGHKGKPCFTHFHVQDSIPEQKKGVFTVSYADSVLTILKNGKLVAKIRVEESQTVRRSFSSTDVHGCPNKEILIIDRH